MIARLRRCRFCGTFPRVSPGRRYRPPCPVVSGLSSKAHLLDGGVCASAVARSAPPSSSRRRGRSGQLGGCRQADHHAKSRRRHRAAPRARWSAGDAAGQGDTPPGPRAQRSPQQARLSDSSEETRPCLACGTALRAAREAGTNSSPMPSPNGTSSGERSGPIERNARDAEHRKRRAPRRSRAPPWAARRSVREPPGEGRADSDQHRDHRQRRGGAERRIAGHLWRYCWAMKKAPIMTTNVSAATSAAASDHALAQAGRVRGLVGVHLARARSANRPRGGGGRRDQEPPAGSPVDRDRQQPADDRSDQIRDAGARPPEPKRGAAPFAGKPETAPASEAGLTSPAPDALNDARDDQDVEAACASAPISAPARENRQARRAPTAREPTRSTSVPAGKQHHPVSDEVGGEDAGELVRVDVELLADRRQRDRDDRAVDLKQGRRAGARREP